MRLRRRRSKPGVAFAEMIENIDIGGPSMVRSAAKNFEDVAIVTSAGGLSALMAEELAAHIGCLSRETRWRLAKAAFAVTAAYDAAIATTLESIAAPAPHGEPAVFDGDATADGGAGDRSAEGDAAVWRESAPEGGAVCRMAAAAGVAAAKQLQGKELSYNNLVDLDACWELVSEFVHDARSRRRRWRSSSTRTRAGRRPGRRCWRRISGRLQADPVSAFGGRDRGQPRGGWGGGGGDCEAVCGGDCRAVVYAGGAGAVCGEEEPAAAGDRARRR